DGGHGVPEGVVGVALVRVVEVVAVQTRVPVEGAVEGLAVRVHEQLGRVTPQPVGGFVRTVDAEPVPLTGRHAEQVAVPDVVVDLDELDALFAAVVVDQAELHALGDLREQGEVRAGAVVGGPQRVGGTGPGSD